MGGIKTMQFDPHGTDISPTFDQHGVNLVYNRRLKCRTWKSRSEI